MRSPLTISGDSRRPSSAEQGFSMIEVLAVLVIVGALVVVSIPEFQRSRKRSFAMDQLRGITSTIEFARFEALKRHTYTGLAFHSAGELVVYEDWTRGTGIDYQSNGDRNKDSTEVAFRIHRLRDMFSFDRPDVGSVISLGPSEESVGWKPDGSLNGEGGSVNLEVFVADSSYNYFKIQINSATGSPRILKYDENYINKWVANQRDWVWSY